eukprot:jgi/Chlat1/6355/Chrsp44S05829
MAVPAAHPAHTSVHNDAAAAGREGGGDAPLETGKLAKLLAAADRRIRDKAIQAVTLWLTRHHGVTSADVAKLWRGLFYCMWHSDKQPVQAVLAERIAALVHDLPLPLAALYFEGFMATMHREWAGIDRLRLDKFYMLVRLSLQHMQRYVATHSWHAKALKAFTNPLRHTLLDDIHPCQGLNLHIADLYVDTLTSQEEHNLSPPPPQALLSLLEPFLEVVTKSTNKTLVTRVSESVFTTLLPSRLTVQNLANNIPVAQLTHRLFNHASAPGVSQRNRKALYELHARYKAEKVPSTSLPTSNGSVEAAADAKVAIKKKQKNKKLASSPMDQQRTPTQQASPPTPMLTASAGHTPGAGKQHKNKKSLPFSDKERDQGNGVDDTPSASGRKEEDCVAATTTPGTSGGSNNSKGKHVRFALKRNQTFRLGMSTTPRKTPPPSAVLGGTPKGSALKKVSKFPDATPATPASLKKQKNKNINKKKRARESTSGTPGGRVTPMAKRPKASDFF